MPGSDNTVQVIWITLNNLYSQDRVFYILYKKLFSDVQLILSIEDSSLKNDSLRRKIRQTLNSATFDLVDWDCLLWVSL